MNQIIAAGHSIVVKGDKLLIDGKVVDAKLKRSLFGGLGSFTTQSMTVSQRGVHGTLKVGRNTIVIDGSKITVNGEEVRLVDEEPEDRQSLNEELNNNAQKYIISTAEEDKIEIDGEICRRIIATQDIIDREGNIIVKKGQKGGYISSRYNLSENGICWIHGNAVVRQDADVRDSAQVLDEADISGNVTIAGHSQVSGNATVRGSVSTSGHAIISGNADIHGNVSLGGNACIRGNADVHGNVSMGGNAEISGNADVHGNVSLAGNVRIAGNADVHGNVVLSGNEVIMNNRQSKDLVGEEDEPIFSAPGIVIGSVGGAKWHDPKRKKSDEDSPDL